MSQGISESLFYMWRTVFALAHADNIVLNEEIRFMAEAIEDVHFSESQRHVLTEDIAVPRDPASMFEKITDQKDQMDFFKFAHEIVWVDGQYVKEEQDIICKLKETHMAGVNIDELVGKIDLELEDDGRGIHKKNKDVKKIVSSFKDRFHK